MAYRCALVRMRMGTILCISNPWCIILSTLLADVPYQACSTLGLPLALATFSKFSLKTSNHVFSIGSVLIHWWKMHGLRFFQENLENLMRARGNPRIKQAWYRISAKNVEAFCVVASKVLGLHPVLILIRSYDL